MWDIMPGKGKNIENQEHFKKVIETWKPHHCLGKLCKAYIKSV